MSELILIVEDDSVQVDALEMFLESRGFGVLVTTTGRETLDLVAGVLPDVILLDTNLPDMTGFSVCQSIKDCEETANIPVIFVSGMVDLASKLQGFSSGGLDYVEKPYELVELEARIRRAVAIKKNDDDLRRRASVDSLTGLLNRARINERMKAEMMGYNPEGRPMACVMLDIDYFKKVNDTHGHTVGDEALKHVGEIIKGQLRHSDILGRLGGEEYVVALPRCGLSPALIVAERIRATLKKRPLVHQGSTVWLTASLGVALHTGETEPGQLIEKADKALYEAKRLGRNRVVYESNGSYKDWTRGDS